MSRRKRRHVREEHAAHAAHEAWVIPYADLLTLLLAFFVVLYAISSVNAGKYRVLSNALFTEFRGAPRSMQPVQVGDGEPDDAEDQAAGDISMINGHPPSMIAPVSTHPGHRPGRQAAAQPLTPSDEHVEAQRTLMRIADDVTRAMADLIQANVVAVHRNHNTIQIEIRTDILYPSGSATLSPDAIGVIQRLVVALQQFPNPVRVEGHTDDRPINTPAFHSNWELSSARAATVVHLLASSGVDASRLSVVGKAEFSPVQANTTEEGRNANRRVAIVIMSTDGSADPGSDPQGDAPAAPATTDPAPARAPAPVTTAALTER